MKKLALSVLVAATVLGSLSACGKKAEKAQEQVVKAAPAAAKTTYPKEMLLDAMLRGHPGGKKVCIDESRDNAFFLDYSHREQNEEYGIFAGSWLFIEQVEFFETSNKSIFITEQKYGNYVRVYPDVTGLTCKER